MFKGLFKKEEKQQMLDSKEAFNLWDVLNAHYNLMQQIQIIQNFVHDKDFNFLLKQTLVKTYETQISELEQVMNTYKVTLPRRPPKSVRTTANTEAFSDQFIAVLLITMLQENIGMYLRAIRTSITNDGIRMLFQRFLITELGTYDNAIKYVKLKGWLGTPPLYPETPSGTGERLDLGEVFHLWDHLCARYDALEVTQIYENYAHDRDLVIILRSGIRNTLEKQINILEKEMDHFGLPLPERPPKSVQTVQNNTEIFEDLVIYRQVFTGLQFMFDIHSIALKQNSTNDRLRKIYLEFLKEEVNVFDKLVKYGKLKGWLRPVPMYRI